MTDLPSAVAFATARLARELRDRTPPGLTVSEMALLAGLEDGPASAADLAARERIKPSSVTRHITALQDRGLIDREVHPEDARYIVLTLTDAGRRALEKARRSFWLAVSLRAMTIAERDALAAALPVLEKLH